MTEDIDMLEQLKAMMAQPIRTELTRRDHFALAALAAMLHPPRSYMTPVGEYAETAYEYADAMEAARGTPTQSTT